MSQKRQLAKINVLKKLLNDENSCVSLVPTTRVLALPPFFLNDMKAGIVHILNGSLKKYDRSLDGILIGYQNIRVLLDENTGIIQIGTAETEVNISVEFFIFQPKIGSCLKGVVNKKSNNHIGCLVHGYFNATILKPVDVEYEDWICKNFNVNDKIVFKVKDLDFTGVLPYIEGTVGEEMLDKAQMSSDDENDTENNVTLNNVFKNTKKNIKDKCKKEESISNVNKDGALMEKAEVNMRNEDEDVTDFVTDFNLKENESSSSSTVKKKKKKKDKDKDKDKSKGHGSNVDESIPTDTVYFEENDDELENTTKKLIQSNLDESESLSDKKKKKKKSKDKDKESVKANGKIEIQNTTNETLINKYIKTQSVTNEQDSESENSNKKKKKMKEGNGKTEQNPQTQTQQYKDINSKKTVNNVVQSGLDESDSGGSKSKKKKKKKKKKKEMKERENSLSEPVWSGHRESDSFSDGSKKKKKKLEKSNEENREGGNTSEQFDRSGLEKALSKIAQSSFEESDSFSEGSKTKKKKELKKSNEKIKPVENILGQSERNSSEKAFSKPIISGLRESDSFSDGSKKKKKKLEKSNEENREGGNTSEQFDRSGLEKACSKLAQSSFEESDSFSEGSKTKKKKELKKSNEKIKPVENILGQSERNSSEKAFSKPIISGLRESDSFSDGSKKKKKKKELEKSNEENREGGNTSEQFDRSGLEKACSKLAQSSFEESDSVSDGSKAKKKKSNEKKKSIGNTLGQAERNSSEKTFHLGHRESDSFSDGSKKRKKKELKKSNEGNKKTENTVVQSERNSLDTALNNLVEAGYGESDSFSDGSDGKIGKKNSNKKVKTLGNTIEQSDQNSLEKTVSSLVQSALNEKLGISQQENKNTKSFKVGESTSNIKQTDLSKNKFTKSESASCQSEKSDSNDLDFYQKENDKNKKTEEGNKSTGNMSSQSEQQDVRLGSTISKLIQSSLAENDLLLKKLNKKKKQKELENTLKMAKKDNKVNEKVVKVKNTVNEIESSYDDNFQDLNNKKTKKKKKEDDESGSHLENDINALIKSTLKEKERELESLGVETNMSVNNIGLVNEKKLRMKKKREKDVFTTTENAERKTINSTLTINNGGELHLKTMVDKNENNVNNLSKEKDKKADKNFSQFEKVKNKKKMATTGPTATPDVHMTKNKKGKTQITEKENKKSTELSFQQEDNYINESSIQKKEEMDNIFHSTQIEPFKTRQKMETFFCSPIQPDSMKKQKKNKKGEQENSVQSVMDSPVPKPEQKKDEVKLDDGKTKKDRKRKRGEDEESEVSPIVAKKVKKTNSLPSTLSKKDIKESKNLGVREKRLNSSRKKTEGENNTTGSNRVEVSSLLNSKNTESTVISKSSEKTDRATVVNKSKEEKKEEDSSHVVSLYQKLLEEAKNAISNNVDVDSESSVTFSEKSQKNKTSNPSESGSKSKKDKTEKGSKSTEREKQKSGKKRKREENDEVPETPSKKLKNGNMYDFSTSPEKMAEDSSLFSDGEKSLSPEKKSKRVNGFTAKEKTGSDEVRREETPELKTTEKGKKGKKAKKSEEAGSKESKKSDEENVKQSLYEKLLIDAKNLFQSSTASAATSVEVKTEKKKEKTDLKQKTIKDYLHHFSQK